MLTLCSIQFSIAQPTLASVTQEINQINAAYQTGSFLAFDIDVTLQTDTVLGYFENQADQVNYVINGNHFYYASGEAEFMQDDSFAITTYNKEQIMYLVRKGQDIKSLLPLKNFNDSSLYYYFQYYTVTAGPAANGEEEISFVTDSSWAHYKKIRMQYDAGTHLLSEVEFWFNDPATPRYDEDSLGNLLPETPPTLAKKIRMKFGQYRFVANGEIFNHRRYVYYDRMKKEYMGTGKYKGYRVMASNITNYTNKRDDVETPYQSGANKF